MGANAAAGGVPLRVFYVIHFAAFGAWLPFLPPWLEARGVVGLAMGLVLGVAPLVGIVAPLVVGTIADVFGMRAQLLKLGGVVGALSMLALGAAAWLGAGPGALTVGAMMACVAVLALARTPLFGIADVLALESLRGDTASFGRIRLWGSLGFAIAALGAGFVIDVASTLAFPVTIAILYGLTAVAALLLPARVAPLAHPSWEAIRAMGQHAPFFATFALWQLSNASYDTMYSLRVRAGGLGDGHAGLLWAVGVAAEIVLMIFAPRIFAAFRPRALLLFGVLACVVRAAGVAASESFVGLGVTQLLNAFTFALPWLVANSHLPVIAPEGRLATAQGALAASVAVGSVFGNILWPAVARASSPSTVFACASVIALVALAPAVAAMKPAERRDFTTEPRSPREGN